MRDPYGDAQASNDIGEMEIPKILVARNPPSSSIFNSSSNFIHIFFYIFKNFPISPEPN